MTSIMQKVRRADVKTISVPLVMLTALMKEPPTGYNAVGYVIKHHQNKTPDKYKMHMNAITADVKKFCDLSFRGW